MSENELNVYEEALDEAAPPHDEIWLQWSGPDYPEDAERYFHDDVTWCKDQINPEDVRYVRDDLVRQEGMKMANVPLVDQLSEMDEYVAELEAANSTLVDEGLRAQKRGDYHVAAANKRIAEYEESVANWEASNDALVNEMKRAAERIAELEAENANQLAALQLCVASLNAWARKSDPDIRPYTVDGYLNTLPDVKA